MSSKRKGRPKLDPTDPDPSINVHWRLPAKTYDRAWQKATALRLSVPEYVRRLLSEKIDTPRE